MKECKFPNSISMVFSSLIYIHSQNPNIFKKIRKKVPKKAKILTKVFRKDVFFSEIMTEIFIFCEKDSLFSRLGALQGKNDY